MPHKRGTTSHILDLLCRHHAHRLFTRLLERIVFDGIQRAHCISCHSQQLEMASNLVYELHWCCRTLHQWRVWDYRGPNLPGPIPRTVRDPAAICVRPLEQCTIINRRTRHQNRAYASSIDRAHRLRLFAIASSSSSSSSEDPLRAIFACLHNLSSEKPGKTTKRTQFAPSVVQAKRVLVCVGNGLALVNSPLGLFS